MVRVGVTGGIGSGKTTVCKIFELLGVQVYFSDIKARILMMTDIDLIEKIKDEFGEEIYEGGYELNYKKLAGIVFKDREKLDKLNEMVHKCVIRDYNGWCNEFSRKKYGIIESALIFESGINKQLDYIIGVYAPFRDRMERLTLKGEMTIEEIEQRMKHQMPEEEKMKRCDYAVINDDLHSVMEQVRKLHSFFNSCKTGSFV
jgi:dephospho-CoA kinase